MTKITSIELMNSRAALVSATADLYKLAAFVLAMNQELERVVMVLGDTPQAMLAFIKQRRIVPPEHLQLPEHAHPDHYREIISAWALTPEE